MRTKTKTRGMIVMNDAIIPGGTNTVTPFEYRYQARDRLHRRKRNDTLIWIEEQGSVDNDRCCPDPEIRP